MNPYKLARRTLALTLVAWFGLAVLIHTGAEATESHVSAACVQGNTANVTVFATDHGNSATVTNAYVTAGGVFQAGPSATLSALFVGTVLATGPNPGDAGPAVTHPVTFPSGSYVVAVTLTFTTGFISNGTAAVDLPCGTPTTTTTAAPTTTTPTTTLPSTTVPPSSSTDPTTPTTVAQSTTSDSISGSVVTLPRTGTGSSGGAMWALVLLAAGVALRILGRRPEAATVEP